MRRTCVKCQKPFETERKNGTHCSACIETRNEGRVKASDRSCERCGAGLPRRVGRPAKFCEPCRTRETKPCSLCGVECDPHRGRDYPYCDGCRKGRRRDVQLDTKLRKVYGITLERYEAILKRQGGKCGCCRKTMRQVCVDHNHRTGAVRGLLCQPCNTGIGLLGDDVEGLSKAVAYLKGVDEHTHR